MNKQQPKGVKARELRDKKMLLELQKLEQRRTDPLERREAIGVVAQNYGISVRTVYSIIGKHKEEVKVAKETPAIAQEQIKIQPTAKQMLAYAYDGKRQIDAEVMHDLEVSKEDVKEVLYLQITAHKNRVRLASKYDQKILRKLIEKCLLGDVQAIALYYRTCMDLGLSEDLMAAFIKANPELAQTLEPQNTFALPPLIVTEEGFDMNAYLMQDGNGGA